MASNTNVNPISRLAAAAAALAALAVIGCSGDPVSPVVLPPLDSVRVSPDSADLRVGEIESFTAVAYDTMGAVVAGASFAWSTSDPLGVVLTVDAVGRVRARGEGAAWVYAAAGGLRDSAWVTVWPAQDGWYFQANNANGANLNGVHFLADGRTGWVVGDGGKILATPNGGTTWTVQVSNTSFSLHSVWFTSATEGWATGAGGTVLHTLNAGATWTRAITGTSERLNDVMFADPDHGWAVGTSGTILMTRNGGASWSMLHPTGLTLNGVSFADTLNGWAVGDQGVILGTTNGGASWSVVQPSVTSRNLNSVWRRSAGHAWAVGDQGDAPRTVLAVWELRSAGASHALRGVQFPTDLTGYAVGFNGVTGDILKSTDGGATWDSQVSNASFQLEDVFFVDATHGWAVGRNGTILHTGTGGE